MTNAVAYYATELITTAQTMEMIIDIERTNMYCQGIDCTRSFYMYWTLSEGHKLECFK